MNAYIPKRRSRGEYMPSVLWNLREFGVFVLRAWIVIGWLLIVPAFIYGFKLGPLL